MKGLESTGPTLEEAVEWRTPIWAPAVASALERASVLVPDHARVLEIGYNSGLMSCYMAAHYGWRITGYDIRGSARERASHNAKRFGLERRCEFRTCSPQETFAMTGPYDAVFIKSVLYHIAEREVYRRWLDWLHGVVRKDGVVIAVENGKGGAIDRFYRGIVKKSRWADFLLFDAWTEKELGLRFRSVDIEYFGRLSQFFTRIPAVCKGVQSLEKRLWAPGAGNCFVASIVAQK